MHSLLTMDRCALTQLSLSAKSGMRIPIHPLKLMPAIPNPRCGAEAIAQQGLDDPNPGVRVTAAVALMHLADPANLPLLKGRIDDPHPEVRARIRDAIAAIDVSRPSDS